MLTVKNHKIHFWLLSPVFIFSTLVVIDIFVPTKLLASTEPVIDPIRIVTSAQSTVSLSSLDLNEGSPKTLYITGSIAHEGGCGGLNTSTLYVAFYRNGLAAGPACSGNDNNCYQVGAGVGACTVSGCDLGTETPVSFQCPVTVKHFAEPTDTGIYSGEQWTAYASIQDNVPLTGTASTTTEINSLSALDIDSAVSYGSLNLGATSTVSIPLLISNKGNVKIDTYLYGSALVCEAGTIVVARQRYGLSSDSTYDNMTALSASSTFISFNLDKQTSDTLSSKNIYFKLALPSSGIRGACGGTHTVLAVMDE